jgi:hypothetical protein
LIALVFNAHQLMALAETPSHGIGQRPAFASQSVFRRPGGFGGEPEPDPIPNSAVKLSRANGTKSQDLEE